MRATFGNVRHAVAGREQVKLQLDGDILPSSSKKYQWRHMLVMPHTNNEAHIHVRADIFGEGFDDLLVEVPYATPRLHVRERAYDRPRHGSIRVLGEDTRLLAPTGRKGTLQHPHERVRHRVDCDGLADDTRAVRVVDDGEDTDGHTVPVFHGRVIVERDVPMSIPQSHLRMPVRACVQVLVACMNRC